MCVSRWQRREKLYLHSVFWHKNIWMMSSLTFHEEKRVWDDHQSSTRGFGQGVSLKWPPVWHCIGRPWWFPVPGTSQRLENPYLGLRAWGWSESKIAEPRLGSTWEGLVRSNSKITTRLVPWSLHRELTWNDHQSNPEQSWGRGDHAWGEPSLVP